MSDSADNGEVIYKKGEDDSELDEIWDDTELIKAYDKAVNLAYDAANANLKASGEFDDHTFASPAAKSKHQKKQETNDGDDKQSATPTKKTKKRSKGRKKKNAVMPKWNVGDVCMAKFSEDDLYYEGTVVSMDRSNDACVVRFTGYNNEEEKQISSLRRLSEWNIENTVSDSGEESQSTDMSSCNESGHNKVAHEASKFAFQKLMSNMANGCDEIGSTTAVPLLPPPMPPGFLRPNDGPPSDNEAMASMLMSWYMSGYHTGYYQALTDAKKKRSKLQ